MHQGKLCILLSVFCLLTLYSCKIGRFFWYNYANISDHKIFPYRKINNSDQPFYFQYGRTVAKSISIKNQDEAIALDDYLPTSKTVAFLVIKSDSILYERYYHHYQDSSLVASFSVAKSFVSALTGIAVEEGHIKNIEQPITDYLPGLKDEGFKQITIKHLLQMTSGIKYSENYYTPFSGAAGSYYGTNLRKAISRLKIKNPPGKMFHYQSINTQLLALILERAVKKDVSSYLGKKIWQPLGMEHNATWSLDRKKNGLEKAFCCLNACTHDFAKFGRLYLNKGNWNGIQIIPEYWITASTKKDTTEGSKWYYQYQWWIGSDKYGDFSARGHLGQYIYVHPKKNIIIVRLGKKYGNTEWINIFRQIVDQI